VYAAKTKRLFNKLRREYGKPDPVERTDPVEQAVLAILSRDTSESRAAKAFAKLRAATVDLNDLRVTTMPDIVETLGAQYPDAQSRARDVRDVLSDIFNRESILNLDFLRDRARREARQYLESLNGVDAYAAASVMLWSLGGHAIPVDEQLIEVLRRKELVARRSDRAEVQAFLEHHVSAADAQAFTILIHRYAAAHALRSAPAAGADRTKKAVGAAKPKKATAKARATTKLKSARRTGKTKKKTAARRKSKATARATKSATRGRSTTKKTKRRTSVSSRRKTGGR